MSLISGAVAIANSVANSLKMQSDVYQEVSAGVDRNGKHIYPSKIARKAVVDMKQQQVRTPSGDMALSKASVLFLDPAIVVKFTDRITLPDGSTGPILAIDGFVDGETNAQALSEVYLG